MKPGDLVRLASGTSRGRLMIVTECYTSFFGALWVALIDPRTGARESHQPFNLEMVQER